MDAEDLKSRGIGLLCTCMGAGLSWWAWTSAMSKGQYSLKAALVGPTCLGLGLGLLIHGKGIPTSGATVLTRVYGFAGGLGAIALLCSLGYFEQVRKSHALSIIELGLPFVMLVIWFLPSRMYGPPAAATPPTEGRGLPRNEPIKPK